MLFRSGPRMSVARLVLATDAHPTAEQVWDALRRAGEDVARATVYKALATLRDAGLVRTFRIEGRTVFDPRTEPHHHVVDVDTGAIVDLPPAALEVRGLDALAGLEVVEHHVVVRARRAERRGDRAAGE